MTLDFTLQNFNGPLDLLLCLIHKQEVDVCSVAIQEITSQFLNREENSIQLGSEFLDLATSLLLLKSKKLLPGEEEESEEEGLNRLELLQHLLEYTQFKELAATLEKREESAHTFFTRTAPPHPSDKKPGLDEVDLATLSSLLGDVMERAAATKGTIADDEEWTVDSKMAWLRTQPTPLPLTDLFHVERSKPELIALFLALLELLKTQELKFVLHPKSSDPNFTDLERQGIALNLVDCEQSTSISALPPDAQSRQIQDQNFWDGALDQHLEKP